MAVQENATKQLGALPFGNIIGGPMVAAIEAQAKAARSTVEFIEGVAFRLDDDGNRTQDLQVVQFKYNSGDQEVDLSVPLLVIVPIPYIRIDDMTIQFKANISAETASEDTTSTRTEAGATASASASYGWGPAKVEANFTASYSAKRDSSSAANSRYSVEYTMDIYIHAVQDDIPAGMQTVLNILNESIQRPQEEP